MLPWQVRSCSVAAMIPRIGHRKPPETLTLLQTFVLALIDQGLRTPYELMKGAGLSIGITSPTLRRFEEAKFIVGEPGPRKRFQFRLTPEGRNALSKSLRAGRGDYWSASGEISYENIPRLAFLLWVYFGSTEMRKGLEWAAAALSHQATKAARSLANLQDDLARLDSGSWHERTALFESPEEAISHPILTGVVCRFLQEAAETVLLQKQVDSIPALVSHLSVLPEFPARGADELGPGPQEG